MVDDVLLNKSATIERCLKRIDIEHSLDDLTTFTEIALKTRGFRSS